MGKSVHLNRPGGKRVPSFGLPPTAVTKKVKSAHFQFFLNSFPRMSIKWSSSAIFSVSILSPCVCSPTPWSTGQTAPWKPFFSSTRATSAPWGPWSGQSLPRDSNLDGNDWELPEGATSSKCSARRSNRCDAKNWLKNVWTHPFYS